MKKRLPLILIVGLLTLFIGTFFACTPKDVIVPTPEVVGGEETCDHEYEESQYVEATCTERAHIVYVCEKCGDTYTIYDGDYAPHTMASRKRSGNCVSYGYTEHYCSVCGKTISTEYDTVYGDHSYKTVNRHVEGNCRTLGYTIVRECTLCGDRIIVEDATYGNHAYKKTEHVEATCISFDYDVYTCTLCGDKFFDYGTETVEHVFEETTTPGADCLHNGTLTRRCVNCGLIETEMLNATGPHTYREMSGADEGYHICTVCNKPETKKAHEMKCMPVSGATHCFYCAACGYVDASGSAEHSFSTTVIEATCEKNGVTTYTCDDCRYSYTEVIPAKHRYDLTAGRYVAASCTENGYTEYTCADCLHVLRVGAAGADRSSSSIGFVPTIRVTLDGLNTGDVVSLGSYPQSRVHSSVLQTALDEKAGEVPSVFSGNGKWTTYAYVAENKSVEIAWYIDVSYAGEKYRGVYFTDYRPADVVSKVGPSFSYVDDNGFTAGKTYWFLFEPISWKVLSAEDKLLISEVVLDSAEYAFVTDPELPGKIFSAEELEKVSSFSLLAKSDADNYFVGEYNENRCKTVTAYAASQGAYAPDASWCGSWWTAQTYDSDKTAVVRFGYDVSLASGHEYVTKIGADNLKSAATCRDFAVYYVYCEKCGAFSGETFEDEDNGYTLHSYAYVVSATGHVRTCSVCGESMPPEAHTLTCVDNGNGLNHTASCSVCGYSAKQEHSYVGTTCSACLAEKITYISCWDVSEYGTEDLMAYLTSANKIVFRGAGRMKNYSSTELPPYYSHRETVSSVEFSSGMTTIGAYAFYSFGEIRSLVIPNNVQSIGSHAFSYLTKLNSLTYNAVSCGDFSTENGVFAGMGSSTDNLQITLGADVERIPAYFMYPSKQELPRVRTMTVSGDKIRFVGDYAFASFSGKTSALSLASAERVGKYAFYNNDVDRIFLGDALSSVGEYAFYDCSAVFMGEPLVKSLGKYAFYNCTGMSAVRLSGIATVPAYAFYNDTAMTNVSFDSVVRTIDEYAFYGCSNVISSLPSSLKSVGAYAFAGSGFSGSVLNDLTTVGNYSFLGCNNLLSVSAEKLASVGAYAFSECAGLRLFSAQQLTSISEGAFADDPELTTVGFSDKLSAISSKAFYRCERLLTFTLSASLSSIARDAFFGCYRLAELDNRSSLNLQIGATSNGYVSTYARRIYDGRTASSLMQTVPLGSGEGYALGSVLLTYVGDDEELIIPADLIVGAYSFYGRQDVVKVTVLSDKVEKYAFSGATRLQEAVLTGVQTVEDGAFGNCPALRKVAFGASATTVAQNAFRYDLVSEMTVHNSDLQQIVLSSDGYFSSVTIDKFVFPNALVSDLAGYAGSAEGGSAVYTINHSREEVAAGTLSSVSFIVYRTERGEYELVLTGTGSVPELFDAVSSYAAEIVRATVSDGITAIGDSAFTRFEALKSVSLPSGVTAIGDNAFNGTRLTEISLPATLETIGSYAFFATSPEEVNIPDSVASIGSYAFGNCALLERVSLPSGIASIPEGAFAECGKLNTVLSAYTSVYGNEILGKVVLDKSVGEKAFYECASIRSVEIGTSAIGEKAFAGCLSLAELQLGAQVSSIASAAFYDCRSLLSVELPSGLTTLGKGAFAECIGVETLVYNCASLGNVGRDNEIFYNLGRNATNGVSVTITSTALSLPAYLFNPVYSLSSISPKITSLVIENGVKNVGEYAFRNLTELGVLLIPGAVETLGTGVVSGTRPTEITLPFLTSPLVSYFGGNVPDCLTEVTVLSCETIPEDAFASCRHIERINLDPDFVSAIGNGAFADCSALTTVGTEEGKVIFRALTSVGDNAFYGCGLLTEVSLSAAVGFTMGNNVFENCVGLHTVALENNTSQGKGVFLSCGALESLTSTGGNIYVDDADGAFGIYRLTSSGGTDYASLVGFAGGARSYAVANTIERSGTIYVVTGISADAFAYQTALTSVTLNANLTVIGDRAFYMCGSLSSVDVRNCSELWRVGEDAFYCCSALRYAGASTSDPNVKDAFVLPDNVTTIGSNAFVSCASLTEFRLPQMISAGGLGTGVFVDCRRLRLFTFGGNLLTTIPERTFSSCSLLGVKNEDGSVTSLVLPSAVTMIGEKAFEQCSSLVSVVLPDSLQRIERYAFSHCKSLSALSVPDRVSYLGESVLNGCVGLESLVLGQNLAMLGMGAFSGCSGLKEITVPFVGSSSTLTSSDTAYPFGYIFGATSFDGSVRTEQMCYSEERYVNVVYYLPRTLKKVIVLSGAIDHGAFMGCNMLETVDIARTNVERIGKRAFSGCSSLKTVVFPTTVTTIAQEAFYFCTSFTDIVLPAKVVNLDKTALARTGYYNSSKNWTNGVLYVQVQKGEGTVLYAVDSSPSVSGVCRVKDGTVRILEKAFENSGFTEVYLPDSLEVIGFGFLKGNKTINLLSVPFIGETTSQNNYLSFFFGEELPSEGTTKEKDANSSPDGLPESLATLIVTQGDVANNCCNGSKYLKNVILQSGCRSVGSYAFANCASLLSVSIPDTVERIEVFAFEFCEALEGVVIPQTISYIGKGAFANCTAMTYYSAPFLGDEGEIKDSSFLGYAFWPSNKDNLTAAEQTGVVPAMLSTVIISGSGNRNSLPLGSFYGCQNIRTVVLSSSINNIKAEAFAGCNALSTVYVVGSYSFTPTMDDMNPENYRKYTDATKHYIYFGDETAIKNLVDGAENTYENTLYNTDGKDVSVEYSSSDPQIASVSDTTAGTIVLCAVGRATITARLKIDDFYVSISYTLVIN